MRINADFTRRALVVPDDRNWILSPAHGVERMMLDRIGDEVARATSLVRYSDGSKFDRHMHARGEEFLVLEGVFSDEHGDYPIGTYVRNPPGTGHSPFSVEGCVILVKLRQFHDDDLAPVVASTTESGCWPAAQSRLLLHHFKSEIVTMHRIATGESISLGDDNGAECLVFQGLLTTNDSSLPPWSWLRIPPGDAVSLTANQGSVVWMKTGHLNPVK